MSSSSLQIAPETTPAGNAKQPRTTILRAITTAKTPLLETHKSRPTTSPESRRQPRRHEGGRRV